MATFRPGSVGARAGRITRLAVIDADACGERERSRRHASYRRCLLAGERWRSRRRARLRLRLSEACQVATELRERWRTRFR